MKNCLIIYFYEKVFGDENEKKNEQKLVTKTKIALRVFNICQRLINS